MEDIGRGTEVPFDTVEKAAKQQDDHHEFKVPECVRWIKRGDLDDNPHLRELMVPVCDSRDSKGGDLWYIARIPHVVGIDLCSPA